MTDQYRYLLHAVDETGKWEEVVTTKTNTSEVWATFLWQNIITRFGCVPVIVCDGGPEFKGAAGLILTRYNIAVVVTESPYNPKANGVVERSGQTLQNAILKACELSSVHVTHLHKYRVHAALLAVRTTVSRATGYTPYYLTYGQEC